jgi:hypothetical protein
MATAKQAGCQELPTAETHEDRGIERPVNVLARHPFETQYKYANPPYLASFPDRFLGLSPRFAEFCVKICKAPPTFFTRFRQKQENQSERQRSF